MLETDLVHELHDLIREEARDLMPDLTPVCLPPVFLLWQKLLPAHSVPQVVMCEGVGGVQECVLVLWVHALVVWCCVECLLQHCMCVGSRWQGWHACCLLQHCVRMWVGG